MLQVRQSLSDRRLVVPTRSRRILHSMVGGSIGGGLSASRSLRGVSRPVDGSAQRRLESVQMPEYAHESIELLAVSPLGALQSLLDARRAPLGGPRNACLQFPQARDVGLLLAFLHLGALA